MNKHNDIKTLLENEDIQVELYNAVFNAEYAKSSVRFDYNLMTRDDIFQEAWFPFKRALDRYCQDNNSQASVWTYVSHRVGGAIRDYRKSVYRYRSKTRMCFLEELTEAGFEPKDKINSWENQDNRIDLDVMFSTLSDREINVLTDFYIKGISRREIGRKMVSKWGKVGIHEIRVWYIIQEALAKLRQWKK